MIFKTKHLGGTVLSLLVAFFASPFEKVHSQQAVHATQGTVTFKGIDRARIGMTVGELKRAYPGAKLTGPAPGICVNEISVELDGKVIMQFTTEDADGEAYYCDKPPPSTSVISYLMTDRKEYKTLEGIGVGSKVSDAERLYGRARIMAPQDEETHWWIEFARHPKGTKTVIGFAADPRTLGRAKDLKKDLKKGVLQHPSPNAQISTLSVGSR